MVEIAEFEVVAAETKSNEQIKRLEKRISDLESQPAIPRPESGKMAQQEQRIENQERYVLDRVSKGKKRRAKLAEELGEIQ